MAPLKGMLKLGQLRFEKQIFKTSCRGFMKPHPAPGSTSYYVLLPEIPPDTRDTNPILRVDEYPQFSKINPDLCITAAAKRSIEFDVEVGNFMESLKDTKEELTFEQIFNPLEERLVPLNFAQATTKQLHYVKSNKEALYKEAFQRIHLQVENAKSQRWMNEDLFSAVKKLNSKRDSLNDCQKRLIDRYLLNGRMNGIHLAPEPRRSYMAIAVRLAEYKTHFRDRVSITAGEFSHIEENTNYLEEFSKEFLNQISINKADPARGPWKFTLNENVYDTVMSHCSDRMTRWNIWYAYNNRASMDFMDRFLSNHTTIEDIRRHRMDIGKLLKKPTFADVAMETKMAGTVDNVMAFIKQSKDKFQPIAEEEMASLQQFATSEGFQHKLEAWDISYWRRRHLEHMHKMDQKELSNYFPLPRVLEYLFAYSRILFGLRFEEHTGSVDVWNEDVKFYKVYDDATNTFLSAFYLDPYARPGSKLNASWIEIGRERSDIVGTTPFSYIGLKMDKPAPGEPCLVTFHQLQHLFYMFGNGLQQLATTAPYSEVAGQRNIECDALTTCGHLLKMILNTRETLRTMSRHHITGESLDEDAINTIMKRRHHMTSLDNLTELYYSTLDFKLHLNINKSWHTLMEETWKEFIPYKLDEDDNHLCSLSAIISENQHASYYSEKWAEMLACNIFETFRLASEEGPDSVKVVGKRFRDTYLSLGGSVSAAEVFRRFQGKEPNFDALVSYHLH